MLTIPKEMVIAISLALVSAATFKIPALFGVDLFLGEAKPDAGQDLFYFRNLGFFVFPFLAAYFVWKHGGPLKSNLRIATCFLLAALLTNIYPFKASSSTEILTGLHVPIFLWGLVGLAYMGSDWRAVSKRLDFVRFSGELFICYVLIALGGAILTVTTALLFTAIDIDVQLFIAYWLVPCGAVGATIIATGLVEFKDNPMGTIAPVLTKVFTPLFAILMVAFVVAIMITGNEIGAEREILIGANVLLILVTGLVIYNVIAHPPNNSPNLLDMAQLILVISTLVIDIILLFAIASRITDFGWSPNKAAALAENTILLVQLAGSAWLSVSRYTTKRKSSTSLVTWHMAYLGIAPIWALIVLALFPPLFGYS
jgi:hypothetical protein